jgi:hypothetical protein
VRNVYRVYRRGRAVGTARGPDAVGVVAYELIKGFDHEQYWNDGERRGFDDDRCWSLRTRPKERLAPGADVS